MNTLVRRRAVSMIQAVILGTVMPMYKGEVPEHVDALHPMYAVSGFLVMRAGNLERRLYLSAITLKLVHAYTAAEDLGPEKIIARLMDVAERLPEPARGDLRAGLNAALDVLQLRHALVHGVLLYDADKQLFESQRPPRGKQRRQQVDPERPIWIKHQFTMRDVLDAGRAAEALSNLIQTREASWYDALGLHSDE